jgi:putative ABC transport system substrate-binding protein
MTRRFFIWLVTTVVLSTFSVAEAQHAVKIFRIGYLIGGFPAGTASLLKAFREGLREFGYREGIDFVIEVRWVEGRPERLSALAAELVQLKVDVIVAAPTPPALAAQKATKSIPIVVAHMSDPIDAGLVFNLARTGGNVTGLRSLQAELAGKRLELLKEVFPQVSRVVVLGAIHSPGSQRQLREMDRAAKGLGLELRPLALKLPDPDFHALSSAILEMRANAFTLSSGTGQLDYLKQLSDLPAKIRLPSIYQNRSFAEAGGLMSYGIKWEHFHRRAAYYVDKILKGAKPADLPVEQLTAVEFVVNLKTAKALNFTIPPQVLMDADQVIR